MNAKEIIQLLETPTPDRRPTVRQITEEAAIPRLIVAVQEATTPLTRQLLCDILGTRGDKQAVSVLINALQENVSKVRSSAADALAKIGDAQAGEALMKRLEIEESDGVKSALIYLALRKAYASSSSTGESMMLTETRAARSERMLPITPTGGPPII